ncbi:50S ribosomal protein L6 [Candidatus Roizmanbacteria bacterium RIFCSPLOWO2_01_FULL_41_22]|uniref:50S ribosomal protein L6 n=2 Tax=Candidatus Roizmaniibacteriota TaxID=1752723 RepID=A0A1F7JQ25_9BACT|nr:MAG: 50S ribosomal protein L6 [Candidatus Roizmanbacteria bacterium RIFCSPLOWO2_01_FULL_41_22]OGK57708.1 MAG: 50S ribosomal protein L6 [Candidatus Roizmanbacteria bacterium RIFCSPLOWO2_02_FULL_41_9]
MSKIGQKPVQVLNTVQIAVSGESVHFKGAKGEMTLTFPQKVLEIKQEEGVFLVKRKGNNAKDKALHGLYRSLFANAIFGVEKGWEKRLDVVGTGFTVKLQGQDVVFKLGFSHPVVFKQVAGVQYRVEGTNKVVISGVDKQLVGQVAHQIKMIRRPDVYKGKGIRYEGEVIKLKPGKKAKTA